LAKGRVENGVGYVKKNLLAGLEIPVFAALAPLKMDLPVCVVEMLASPLGSVHRNGLLC
jgi:hypothetical protein